MTFDFSGKNIVITGGTRGIGRAAAELFAASGGNVILTYRSNAEAAGQTLRELTGEGHQIYQLDVSDPGAIQNFFNWYSERFDKLDVLVNNAGVYLEHKILETDFENWQKNWEETIKANLTGPANMCFFAAKLMARNKYGKIINISSRGAFRGEPDHPAYGASKAGLNAMSQSLAMALAPSGISVHIIAPGFVETEMAASALSGEPGDAIKRQSPFSRVARPEEVARLIAVYASDGLEFTSAGIVDINGASYLRS